MHLAHIWPSSKAVQASAMKRVFGLDEGFHLHPRNFLLLEKHVEEAFDNEALLLLPRRAVGDTPSEVWSRPLWLDKLARYASKDPGDAAAAEMNRLRPYLGQHLHVPQAASGKVPYLRLLAWHAVSALRVRSDADVDYVSEFPAGIHATITAGHRDRSAKVFNVLLSVGLIFGLPDE